jgi:dynein heavy chain
LKLFEQTIFRGTIDDLEWRFLLTGGVALENPFPNPAPAWLSEKSWSEIVRCSDLHAFKGFMDEFREKVNIKQGLMCKISSL